MYLIIQSETLTSIDDVPELYFYNINQPYFILLDYNWVDRKKTFKVKNVLTKNITSDFITIFSERNSLVEIQKKNTN